MIKQLNQFTKMKKEEIIKEVENLKIRCAELQAIIDTSTTKEERFLELINECQIRIDKKKYPDSVFYYKNGIKFLEIEKEYLWVSYKNIWSVFETEFNMSYDEIKDFITDMMGKHFKTKPLTPIMIVDAKTFKMGKHFKTKPLTPQWATGTITAQMGKHFFSY